MHVDFLTLACLRDELDRLLGARVQHVMLLDELSIGLELYAGRRHYLLLSAHPQLARICLLSERPRRGPDVEPPILLLLRKWLRGARVTDVTQPPWERVLIFHFEGAQGRCQLIAEMMDRYSNLVLVSPDGRVLDAIKRVGPEVNRRRVTLPGQPYQMPPPQSNRHPPVAVDWVALLRSVSPERPLHAVLTGHLLGVSPTLAHEIATRATGNSLALVRDADPRVVGKCTADLFAPLLNGQWQPHIGLDEHGEIVAWAPYPLFQFPRSEPVATISEAMERFFTIRTGQDAYAIARREVQNAIDAAKRQVEQALIKVRTQIPDEREVQWLREAGELLLIHQHTVEQGAEQVMLPDYEGTVRCITLDPTRSVIENAQLYAKMKDQYLSMVMALAAAIEAKDSYTHGHSQKVMEYAVKIARRMNLPEDEVETIRYAGLLHDIGKIGIKDVILGKPGKLTAEELTEMRKHPRYGATIMEQVDLLREIAPLTLYHHECFDGSGYPMGLKGKDIPLGARILAVADMYDSMVADRPYRKAFPIEQVVQEMRKVAGTQLDPEIVHIFLEILREEGVLGKTA
jgi:HD-GYP domain-containing protein (c-di-GMP phosphodiesterase class II)